MTIENYFERRIRPISEDHKLSPRAAINNNLIDEDQLARTFQEIVNCINLDDDDEGHAATTKTTAATTLNNNFHPHHSLLPEYESIFGGSKGSFNVAVGSKSTNSNNNNSLSTAIGKSFLDDDWFPVAQVNRTSNSNSSSNSNNSNINTSNSNSALVRPPGYPTAMGSSRPVTPSSTVSNGSSSPYRNSFPINNAPPSDYVCKLCNCDGHWMKDCKLYEPRSTSASSISSGSSSSSGNVFKAGLTTANSSSSGHSRTLLPPGNYVCRLCNVAGHWIDQCSKFQPKHLDSTNNSSINTTSTTSVQLPPMLGPGPTPNYRPPAYLSKPVPSNYICNLCNRPGHWIQQCSEFTPIINHKRQ